MVSADPQTLALVKLAGRESIVRPVSHCQVVNMDIVTRNLNVYVNLGGEVVIATFRNARAAAMDTVLLQMNACASMDGQA